MAVTRRGMLFEYEGGNASIELDRIDGRQTITAKRLEELAGRCDIVFIKVEADEDMNVLNCDCIIKTTFGQAELTYDGEHLGIRILVDSPEKYSYSELRSKVLGLIDGLKTSGVKLGDGVLEVLGNANLLVEKLKEISDLKPVAFSVVSEPGFTDAVIYLGKGVVIYPDVDEEGIALPPDDILLRAKVIDKLLADRVGDDFTIVVYDNTISVNVEEKAVIKKSFDEKGLFEFSIDKDFYGKNKNLLVEVCKILGIDVEGVIKAISEEWVSNVVLTLMKRGIEPEVFINYKHGKSANSGFVIFIPEGFAMFDATVHGAIFDEKVLEGLLDSGAVTVVGVSLPPNRQRFEAVLSDKSTKSVEVVDGRVVEE